MPEAIELDPALGAEQIAPGEIPVVDLGGVAEVVARQIGGACRNTGFFYIANHGVAEPLIAQTFSEARRFFALPAAEKAKIAIEKSACHRGWFSIGGENLDPAKQTQAGDFKEGIKIGRDLNAEHPLVRGGTPLHGPNQWPELPGWREAMQGYYDAMETLGRRLMREFAAALGLKPGYFDPWLTVPMTTLGPLHYPPQRGRITQAQLGAGAHTDFGCLTILAQDGVGGLQIHDRAGRWIGAPPLPGTFVVNIGDMMERWTNGIFTSTPHRVINVSGRERYSLPFFFDPDFAAPVECLATCLKPGEAPKYARTTAGQHLLDKISESFAYRKPESG